MFGAPMRLTTRSGLELLMRPMLESDAEPMARGVSRRTVTKYMARTGSMSVEAERAWIESVRDDQKSRAWCIAVLDADHGEDGRPIGNTNVLQKPGGHWTTGSVIFEPEFWGQGIVSATHKARLYYMMRIETVPVLHSQVLFPNVGSWRALENCGYARTGVRTCEKVIDGEMCHMYLLQATDPDDFAWNNVWRNSLSQLGPDVERRAMAARDRAAAALDWAEKNIQF